MDVAEKIVPGPAVLFAPEFCGPIALAENAFLVASLALRDMALPMLIQLQDSVTACCQTDAL